MTITQRQLEDILTHEGIVPYAAVEDPAGYDNGQTELAIMMVTRKLNEILSEQYQQTATHFALIEARRCYFWLAYEREHPCWIMNSGMIWRCRCAAPEIYEATGRTTEEAVKNALARAAEIEVNDQPSRPAGNNS